MIVEQVGKLSTHTHLVGQVIVEQVGKLSTLEATSHEFNMTRTYLEWLVSHPSHQIRVTRSESLDPSR